MANPVTHFEIVGADARALQDFYGDVFAWEVVPAGPSYALVHSQAGTGISGGVGAAPDGSGNRVTVYIEVEDLETTLTKIESYGGSRVVGPMDVPGGPSIALFRDPEGNVIGLTEATFIRGL